MEMSVMKIMFCHDGSERAQKALEKTVEYFKLLKPDIVLMCVAEDILDASSEDERINEEYRQELSEVIHKAAEWVMGNGLEVHVIMATGKPRKMIVETVQKQLPDIVVVARKERSALASVFQNSVSAYLVKNVGCHLMIMGPL
jgi:nucleotide-binding universal stress UspA family protein